MGCCVVAGLVSVRGRFEMLWRFFVEHAELIFADLEVYQVAAVFILVFAFWPCLVEVSGRLRLKRVGLLKVGQNLVEAVLHFLNALLLFVLIVFPVFRWLSCLQDRRRWLGGGVAQKLF